MYSAQKLLEMITSEKSSVRYDACEWLRVRPESSPEIIYALQKATYDSDAEVAGRAAYALQADAHHQLAVQLGLVAPDKPDTPTSMEPAVTIPDELPLSKDQSDHNTMLKDIRSWGMWSLGLGLAHLVATGILSSPWGILLIIVGLASFYFRSASMYVIYGVTLAWASVHNFSSQQGAWIFLSLFQLYATVQVFLNYRRFRTAEQEYQSSVAGQAQDGSSPYKAARTFPWLGAVLGSFSFAGLLFGILFTFVISFIRGSSSAVPKFLYYIIDLTINIGVLGFATGLASILSQYRPKILGIIAMVTGALTLLVDLILVAINLIS